MRPPHYLTRDEADADGWAVTMPSEIYRGWILAPQYRQDVIKMIIRQHSGFVRNGQMFFPTIRPPSPPMVQPVIIEAVQNKLGQRHELNRLVRRHEILTYLDHCRGLVDFRLDGRRNLDQEMIE